MPHHQLIGREQAFMGINNSHEHPLLVKDENKVVESKSHPKKRVFSSVGSRKTRQIKNKKRLQTAKHSTTKSNLGKWRGSNHKPAYTKNYKANVGSTKYYSKKKIPLDEYNWEEKEYKYNDKRPMTAKRISADNIQRPQTNYDAMRRNIQSRGKANPTGLTGTSQSSQRPDGKFPIYKQLYIFL